jgi:hypothetical protein
MAASRRHKRYLNYNIRPRPFLAPHVPAYLRMWLASQRQVPARTLRLLTAAIRKLDPTPDGRHITHLMI